MQQGKRAYRIRVTTPKGNAWLICVSYPIGGTDYGLDFYEIVFSSDLPNETIPHERQATFKEELRARHRASKSFASGQQSEVEFIGELMRDVYGSAAGIGISKIDETLSSPDP